MFKNPKFYETNDAHIGEGSIAQFMSEPWTSTRKWQDKSGIPQRVLEYHENRSQRISMKKSPDFPRK